MFFSNERAKQSPKAEVKLPKDIRSLFASPEETEARYERLHDRTLVTRLQAATEFEALLTTQPPRWFGGEAPLADTDEVNKLLPYVRRVFQDSSATVEELDIAIRLGVATLLHHRESDARDMANDLFKVVAFNRFKEEYEDAVTSALDALALLSATHPAHTLPAIARLIEEVDPADDIDSVFAAFLTLAALASTESTITSVRPWIERGLRSENSDVLLAALQALAIVRERLGELKEPSLLADAQRASPSVAAHNRKPIAALMRALETNEVPDEELTLDFSSSRRGRVVEIVVVGLYHQLVLHTLREFVKSGLQWYISAVPNVAEAIGVDSADIAQRSVTDMDNRAMEYDRQQRTVDRERGRRDARDAKSRSHDAGDE